MPFEPLQTDEKRTPQQDRVKEFEGQMMFGCMTIGLGSFAVFAITAWPWFVVAEYRIVGLTQAALWGMLPATLLGIFLTIRFGIAGGSALAGGSLISAIFIFLRLDQSLLRSLVPDIPQPDYPESWKVLLPLTYVLVNLILIGIFMPKKEFLTDGEKENSR